MKTKRYLSVGILLIILPWHNLLFSQIGQKNESLLWQREYNAVVNGENVAGAYIGGKNDATPTFVDIDADGDQDLFIGEYGGAISFYRNDGTPQNPSWVFITENYNSIDVGVWSTPTFTDIDSDGDFDLFIGENYGGISFYRNDGNQYSPVWTLVTANYNSIYVGYTSAPAFSDIDNDGDQDLFIGEENGNINFYRNIGTQNEPAWTNVSSYYNSIDVGSYSTPAFTDIDGDGDLDLFIGEVSGTINFYRNDGTAATPSWILVSESYNSINLGIYARCAPAFTDIDADGDKDLFIGEKDNWNVNFYLNEGTPNEPLWSTGNNINNSINVGGSSRLAFSDIDGDEDLDMFIGENDGNINFYRNEGTPAIPSWVLVSECFDSINLGVYSSCTPVFTDIDADGDSDLFIGERDGNLNFYRNDGTPDEPSFIFDTDSYNSIDVGLSSAPTFADIDGDDDLDLFIGEETGNINFYRNDGTPGLPAWSFVSENYQSIMVGTWSFPAFNDIDEDGDLDLFIGEYDGNVNFYRNDGSANDASFVFVVSNYNTIDVGSTSAPVFADIDNDGDNDFFAGESHGGIFFWRRLSYNVDLIVEIVQTAQLNKIGDSIEIFSGIKNQGIDTARNFTVDFYLSPDTLINTNDVFVGSKDICELTPATSSSDTSKFLIADNTKLGWYYLGAIIDAQGDVPEYNEVNNTKYYSSKIYISSTGNYNEPPCLYGGKVTPETGHTETDYIFSVAYSDVDNEPPSNILVNIDNTSQHVMNRKDGDGDFTNGEIFEYQTKLGTGQHTYAFAANDAYFSANGDTYPHEGPIVDSTNTPPALSNGTVYPAAGTPGTDFCFTVVYTDAENDTSSGVFVSIDDDSPIAMLPSTAYDDNTLDGIIYEHRMKLGVGDHTYKFSGSNAYANATGDTALHGGPTVSLSGVVSVLTDGTLSPQYGFPDTEFTFNVKYSNGDNCPPSSINVKIDDVIYPMSLVNSDSPDFVVGEGYQYKTYLDTGAHIFSFIAICNDILAGGDTAQHYGPEVAMTPGTFKPMAGRWKGITDQGYPVVFSVSDDGAKILNFSSSVLTSFMSIYNGDTTIYYYTIDKSAAEISISNNYFNKPFTGDPYNYTRFWGTFTNPISINGGMEGMHQTYSRTLVGSGTWNASLLTDIQITFPLNNILVNTPTIEVRGIASGYLVRSAAINGIPVALNNGLFTSNVTLDEGANQITLVAFDDSNHLVGTYSIDVSLDITSPVVEITNPTSNLETTQQELEIIGTVDDPSILYVDVNGLQVCVVEGHFNVNVPLKIGDNAVLVTCYDKAGNKGEDSINVVLTCMNSGLYLSESICNGESYQVGDSIYTQTGVYVTTMPNSSGCDSIVTLDLIVNSNYETSQSATICQGETYTFGTQSLTTAGSYTGTFTSIYGCDSTVTLNLSVIPTYNESVSASICSGESYSFGTQTLTSEGSYTEIFQSISGCDSTVTLDLSVNPIYNESVSTSICSGASYSFGNQSLTSAGIYTEVFQSVSGCDSTVALTLSVDPVYSESISASICNGASYTFGTQTLTSAGIYTEIFQSVSGCDSSITLNLTEDPVYNQSVTASICQGHIYSLGDQILTTAGNYTEVFSSVSGCDSIINLTLNVNPKYTISEQVSSCKGIPYVFGDNVLTSEGFYHEMFQTVFGCDSSVSIYLYIDTVDVSLSGGANVIFANNPYGTYQWINCDGNSPIEGETDRKYTATANGSYAVIITESFMNDNICVDTSECVSITGVGITTESVNHYIDVYPNPTTGELIIEVTRSCIIEIRDILGKIILNTKFDSGTKIINLSGLPDGLYFMFTPDFKDRRCVKIIKTSY